MIERLVVVSCLVLSWTAWSAEQQTTQTATVIDGHTLEVNGRRYRLDGVVAPSLGEICTVRGQNRDCGRIARAQLQDLSVGASVICRVTEPSHREPVRARCLADGYDLSYGMVYTGWARDVDGVYRETEIEARDRRRGMWNSGPNNYPDMR